MIDMDLEEVSSSDHAMAEEYEKVQLKKVANNKELQDMLFRQLREISEEDTRKLFQDGGNFELSNDQDLIRMLKMLASLKQRTDMHHNTQATQGGQGQQLNAQYLKQTAHKAPTKAPSGRPNPRKRR